jgi:hypothetical protein
VNIPVFSPGSLVVVREGITKGQFGKVQKFDKSCGKWKISFDESWVGWYAATELQPVHELEIVNDCLAKLARLDWRPVAAGLPTEEDGDELGDVEWSDGKSIWQGLWSNTYANRNGNHWRPIHLPKL